MIQSSIRSFLGFTPRLLVVAVALFLWSEEISMLSSVSSAYEKKVVRLDGSPSLRR